MDNDAPPATAPEMDRAQALRLFPTAGALAAALDHTLLKPEATVEQAGYDVMWPRSMVSPAPW